MSIVAQYKSFTKRRILFILIVIVLLLVVSLFAIISGVAGISLHNVFSVAFGQGSDFAQQVVLKIRLPRILGAILAGTVLSVSGAVMQSILRNPLASPFTLGISGAAAFGAAFAIVVFGAGSNYSGSNDAVIVHNPYIVIASAFAWSIASLAVILLISKFRGATPEVMILSGIIISSLFSAGISALQYFANDVQLASVIFWSFGDLGRAGWNDVIILSIVLVPLLAFFFSQSWNYKSLQSGDELAKSLGVNVSKVRLTGMVAASLCTAVVVSFYGIIAFVGLVVPHIVRRCIGGDEQFLIPASAVFGGTFLLFSDTIARTIISPVILPVGILTSFIGAPLFLFLLIKGLGKGYWS
ncbi:MAG TPA: iron ABC transporter permease [Bacteroidales bacterium]|nr:iron ABC transporter permease [Bacteroidales bacterium]